MEPEHSQKQDAIQGKVLGWLGFIAAVVAALTLIITNTESLKDAFIHLFSPKPAAVADKSPTAVSALPGRPSPGLQATSTPQVKPNSTRSLSAFEQSLRGYWRMRTWSEDDTTVEGVGEINFYEENGELRVNGKIRSTQVYHHKPVLRFEINGDFDSVNITYNGEVPPILRTKTIQKS